jgi:tetratricopeptide (TPR) repeat protein/O-antigen ligase
MITLALYLLSTALSLQWRVSLEVTMTVLMSIAVFYVLSDGRALLRWQVEAAFMLALLGAAVWALWIVGGDYLDDLRLRQAVQGSLSAGDLIPPTVPKLHGVGDHPNLLGAMLAMGVPFFVVGVFRRGSLAQRVLFALSGALLCLAVFLSLARSAWIAAAVGSAASLLLYVVLTPDGRAFVTRLWPHSQVMRWLTALAIVVPIVAVTLGILLLAQSSEARPIWLFRQSDDPRWDTIEAGSEMFADYPGTGTGPGVYPLLYPEYSGRHPGHAFHTHNGYLQAAVDLGVPGFLAMAGLAGAAAWLIWRGLRAPESEAQLSAAACAGALAAFGVFSVFDAPNGFKGPLVALAAVGAILVLSARGDPPPLPISPDAAWARAGRFLELGARAVVPVVLAGLLVTWARLDMPHYFYSGGVSNANAQRWPQAVDDAERAVELDPESAIYRLQLGSAEGQAFLATGNPVLLEDAIDELERGLELEPRSAIGHANLALLLAEANLRERAREEALLAVRYANSDPAVVLAAGTALEAGNFGEDAIDAYRQALFLDGNLADSPFWSGSDFREASFDEVVGRSALVFNPCTLLALASASVPDGPMTRDDALTACMGQVAGNPGNLGARITLANALIEDEDFSGALSHLDYVLDRQPDNGRARTALGRWYNAQGLIDEARDQWLLGAQLDEVDSLVLLGDSYSADQVPDEVVDELRGQLRQQTSQVQFHLVGILYYRFKFFRASPHVIILPGEWQQAVPGRYARARDALERWEAQ